MDVDPNGKDQLYVDRLTNLIDNFVPISIQKKFEGKGPRFLQNKI